MYDVVYHELKTVLKLRKVVFMFLFQILIFFVFIY